MVSSVYWEWELLLYAIKLGIKLAFVYDGIRMFRLFFSHGNVAISIEDFFFWMYSGVIIFQFQLEYSNGVLRGFSILGMLFGMYVYNKILGERIIRLAEKGICFMKRQLTKFVNMFKIKLCKHNDVSKKNRSKHGSKKKTGKKKSDAGTKAE